MTHLLGPHSVKYQDDAGIFQPLENLLFCRYGKTLRSQNSCNTQIEGYFCPQNLSGIAKNDCFSRQGKSNTSYLCPICNSVLKLRGIGVTVNPSDLEQTQNSKSNKPYYLICHNCRWSTKDVNLDNHDQIGNEWETPKNPHSDYFNKTKKFLLEDYTNYLKETDERDLKIKQHQENVQRKRASAPKLGKMSNNPLANIIAEKYGNKWGGGDALAKLKDKAGGKIFGLSKEKFLKVNTAPDLNSFENEEDNIQKSTVVRRFDPEADSRMVDCIKKIDSLESYTNLDQRLRSPSVQPVLKSDLRPLAGPVVMQASLKYDGHRLIKPDFNPANTKPKIVNLGIETVPNIEIEGFNLEDFKRNKVIEIYITNPNYRPTNLYLLPFYAESELESGEIGRNELDNARILNCSCPSDQVLLQGSVQGVAVDSEILKVSEDLVCFGNKCKVRLVVDEIDDEIMDVQKFFVGLKIKFDYADTLAPVLLGSGKSKDKEKSGEKVQPKIHWIESKILLEISV